MFVIDTNLVSEAFRLRPDPGVIEWLDRTPRRQLMLSTVVIGELYLGLALMPVGERRHALSAMTEAFINEGGDETILAFGKKEALHFASIAAGRRSIGRPITEPDAQIAATAAANDMPVVTRNTRDFEDCGIEIINPWANGT